MRKFVLAVATAALAATVPAAPADAADYLGIGMRIETYASGATAQICATAVKLGPGAALTTDIVLNVTGSEVSSNGLVTPLFSTKQQVSFSNFARVCSDVLQVGGDLSSYVLHVAAAGATTTGVATFAGECEAALVRALGTANAPVIVNGCP